MKVVRSQDSKANNMSRDNNTTEERSAPQTWHGLVSPTSVGAVSRLKAADRAGHGHGGGRSGRAWRRRWDGGDPS